MRLRKKTSIKQAYLLFIILCCIPGFVSQNLKAGNVVIKTATLAPEGSDYYQVLQDIAVEWKEITDGVVTMRLYPGGVVGDERDAVRKMRIGQFQAAALTTKGLHEVDENVYALNYPMMVQSWEELDWLRSRLSGDLEENLKEKGFELLFWADVGWVYFFSTKPILKPGDVKNLKLFTRATDFDDLQLWKSAGFNPVPLTTNDVLPGLQTGLIDVVQSPAFLALSSQWFGVANHMLDVKWSAMSGGLVVTNQAWNSIPAQYRDTLRQVAEEHSRRFKNEIRYNSEEAIDVMQKHGLVVHTPDEEIQELWVEETVKYYPKFEGVLVPSEMHRKVMDLWEQLKQRRKATSSEPSPDSG